MRNKSYSFHLNPQYPNVHGTLKVVVIYDDAEAAKRTLSDLSESAGSSDGPSSSRALLATSYFDLGRPGSQRHRDEAYGSMEKANVVIVATNDAVGLDSVRGYLERCLRDTPGLVIFSLMGPTELWTVRRESTKARIGPLADPNAKTYLRADGGLGVRAKSASAKRRAVDATNHLS